MPELLAKGSIDVRVRWITLGQHGGFHLHSFIDTPNVSGTDVQNAVNQMNAWLNLAATKVLWSLDTTIDEIKGKATDHLGGPEYSVVTSIAGGNPSPTQSLAQCACMAMRSGVEGRENNGKLYFVPAPQLAYIDARTFSSSYMSAIATQFALLLSTYQPAVGNLWSVISYKYNTHAVILDAFNTVNVRFQRRRANNG